MKSAWIGWIATKMKKLSYLIVGFVLTFCFVQRNLHGQNCVNAPANLVTWLAGDGNASDQMGNNPGTIVGGVTFSPGEAGGAFNFDGTTGYIYLPASSSLDVADTGTGLTVECWINISTLTNLMPIAEWNNGSGFGVHFWVNESGSGATSGHGALYANCVSGGQNHNYGSADGVLNTSGWQHIAMTYNETTGAGFIYYNGAVVASHNDGIYIPQTTYDLYLGCRPYPTPGAAFFAGQMDEVGIYNRALSASEIQSIYLAGSAGKCKPASALPQIVIQPASVTNSVGGEVIFEVVASGGGLTYQWLFDGASISGATNFVLDLTNVQFNQAGNYSVAVSNIFGVANSDNASLTVLALQTNCISTAFGLVSSWSGENNANDSLTNNNGSLTNSVGFTNGETGRAFVMNGLGANVFIPASASLNVGAPGTGMTLEGWIKPGDLNTSAALFEWTSSNILGLQFMINISGKSNLYANFQDTSGGNHFFNSPSGILNSSNFQHVAATYDPSSGTGVLYYNGAVVATQILGKFTPQTTFNLSLGSEQAHGGDYYYKGALDEMSLYSRALSAAEIHEIYILGSGRTNCMAPIFPLQPTNQSVTPGTNVTFVAGAFGSLPIQCQWMENGTILPGATNVTLTLTNVMAGNAGVYSLQASNGQGISFSTNATLKIVLVSVYGNNQKLTNSLYSFSGSVSIQFTNFYAGGYIFYTLDGSTPTPFSAIYSDPIILSNNAVIRTLAFSVDFTQFAFSDALSVQVVPSYSLSATTLGGGTITRSPTNLALLSNTVVNLTATSASGWQFLQWQGDLTGSTNTNSVIMTRNKSVQAVFGTVVSNSVGGNGSVVFDPPAKLFPYGYNLLASAVPQPGNIFVLWGNAASGSTNPLSFLVTNANPEISALFTTLGNGQVALTVIPTGHGQVSVNPRANGYTSGASVTVTATPNAGKSFLGWSGSASGNQNPLSVTMNQSKVIYANFSTNYSLSLATLPGGTSQGVALSLIGELGGHYRLDSSTDLVNWTTLFNLTNSAGTLYYLDLSTSNQAQKFYQSVILP